jgi:hypothetical protein
MPRVLAIPSQCDRKPAAPAEKAREVRAAASLVQWRRIGRRDLEDRTMPAKTEKQRRFMGAELERKREGKKTKTDMSEKQLEDFAKKDKKPSK